MDTPFDPESVIISQYGASSIIGGLISGMNGALRQDINFDNFYNAVWNIDTAVGFGLDIWGRIVGLPYGRVITVPPSAFYLGFQDGTTDYAPFNQAPFYVTGDDLSGGGTITLNDTAFRTLILVKALANISDCSIPSINTLISNLFAGRGKCFVEDNGNMEMTYVFEFYLQPYEQAILTNSGALLHPAGVGVNISVEPVGDLFGFEEAGTQNVFGQGVFA